jgi:aminomethyltransferase
MTMRTPLYEEHVKLKARFTEFGGWEMPVMYSTIISEHNAVRTKCGMFDASHMGEFVVSGTGCKSFLDSMVTGNMSTLLPGQARYTLLLNDKGGIVDDLIVYRRENDFFLVVNAGNTEKDLAWLLQHKPADVTIENISSKLCLLALQGPNSQNILQHMIKDHLDKLNYFNFFKPTFNNINPEFCLLARTGYTGEDGFEIFISNAEAPALWQALVTAGAKPCGLGARDTLRLEACMPLHGHEIDDDITPLEASLGWTIFWDKQFIGREAIWHQKIHGVGTYLTALSTESGVPRQGYDIIMQGKVIGTVTSGTFSPTLKKGIALGQTNVKLATDTALQVLINDNLRDAVVVKRPFYKRAQ